MTYANGSTRHATDRRQYAHKDDKKVVASAPGKVILFGEHFVVYGIDAILCAISKRVHVTAAKSPDIQIQSELGSLKHDSYRHHDVTDVDPVLRPLYHIAKESAKITGCSSGVTLHVRSEIPSGAGLGSSSACCVAGAAAALKALRPAKTPQTTDVISMAINAERTVFPNASGADTAASALGGMITYNTKTGYKKIESYKMPEFGLVITNSKLSHNTDAVVSQVAGFRDKNPAKFRELCSKESQVVARVLSILNSKKESGAAKLGRLASINQEYLKAISVSNPALDEIVHAMNDVTFGAKITGAGGGGCVIGFTGKKMNADKTTDGLPSPSSESLSSSLTTSSSAHSKSQLDALKTMSDLGYDCFAADIDNTGLNTF